MNKEDFVEVEKSENVKELKSKIQSAKEQLAEAKEELKEKKISEPFFDFEKLFRKIDRLEIYIYDLYQKLNAIEKTKSEKQEKKTERKEKENEKEKPKFIIGKFD